MSAHGCFKSFDIHLCIRMSIHTIIHPYRIFRCTHSMITNIILSTLSYISLSRLVEAYSAIYFNTNSSETKQLLVCEDYGLTLNLKHSYSQGNCKTFI